MPPSQIAAAVGRFVLELGRFVLMQVAVQLALSAISRLMTNHQEASA